MQGNVVAAARWLGASVVLASAILVAGLRGARTADAGRPVAPVSIAAKSPAAPAPKPTPKEAVATEGHEVPILEEIPAEFAPPNCLDPPSEDEVWAKLPQPGVNVQRSNTRFSIEKIGDTVDPPRSYPLAGVCRLHHCHYKCTVSFIELSWSEGSAPLYKGENRVEVVFIDKDYLTRVGGAAAGR